MTQDNPNTPKVAFKPWPTVGFGLASYFGATILGIWLLAFLSMIFMNEAIDVGSMQDGVLTADMAHQLLRLTCLSAVIGSALIYYLTRSRLGAQTDDYLGLTAISWDNMRPWIAIALGFVFVSGLITYVIDLMTGAEPSTNPLALADPSILMVVTIVIAAPMWEELLFRGFVFAGLRNSPLGTNGAILLSSIWWAGMHLGYSLGGLLAIMCFGILLGLARARFGSVLLPMAMHALYNGTILLFDKMA